MNNRPVVGGTSETLSHPTDINNNKNNATGNCNSTSTHFHSPVIIGVVVAVGFPR
jgi:hypothetical protein